MRVNALRLIGLFSFCLLLLISDIVRAQQESVRKNFRTLIEPVRKGSFEQARAQQFSVFVRFVPDGDTFVDAGGVVYRLKGIDAPEVAHEDRPAQYYAYKSKALLKSLILHKRVRVVVIGEKRDRFNRVLAYVYSGGIFVNEYMILKGAAFCFPHFFQKESFIEKFLIAQRRAITNREGFWRFILSLPVANQHYVGNRKSKRFHTLRCGFGRRISKRNRVMFSSLKEAFWYGYAPCRRCTPWPTVKH